MKNPFEKKIGPKESPMKTKDELKLEIRQVIGYELNGSIYASPQEARKQYILGKLEKIVYGYGVCGGYYIRAESEEAWERLNSLFMTELPIRPLFTEPNV